jgi:hypothetical protein
MVETAAHLTDHVFPRLPVRQWVLSLPKRLRYFMQRDGAVLNMVLRIFFRVIAQSLQSNSPGAAQMDKAALHIGAVAFIHRFGSSQNGHVHFHVCALDGVFEEIPGVGDTDAQSSPPGIVFHPANAIDETAVALVQTDLRRRILRAFVGRGLIESCAAKDMLGYQHSGFSVHAGVLIEAHDRAALERLLRYCARPPFAMDRLRNEGNALVYRCVKQRSEPGSDKRGAKVDELHLTPLELIARITALVPPPRTHRHRYFDVLAQPAYEANRASQHERGRTWSDTAGPCDPTHARACGTSQAFTGALPVGGVDRQNLRGVPAAVPNVRWADAPDRVHYRGRADQEDPRSHRRRLRTSAYFPCTWATVVG